MATDSPNLPSRSLAYPTVLHRNDVVTIPIQPSILDEVIDEIKDTSQDETLSRGYLEQIIAEHQSDCVRGHSVLEFITKLQDSEESFLAGYTDKYVYLIVDKHEVWGGEADWMPWDDEDEYLLTTAYTREVLDVGKSTKADWTLSGIDVSSQAGYIAPIDFPLYSISQEPSIDEDPIELARTAVSLSSETVLPRSVAQCLVLADAVGEINTENPNTTSELLGVGVSEVENMMYDVRAMQQQAKRTTEELSEFELGSHPPNL